MRTHLLACLLVATAGLLTAAFQVAPRPGPTLTPQLAALAEDAEAARAFDYMALKAEGVNYNAMSRALYLRTVAADNDPRCMTEAEAAVQENLAAAQAADDVAAFEDGRAAAADAWSKWTLFFEGLEHGQIAPEQPFTSVSDTYAAAETQTDPRARELLRRTARDQAHRHMMSAGNQVWGDLPPAVRARVMTRIETATCRVDLDNTAWLKADVAEHGWYRISTSGARASSAAWLMAQHADRDRAFQRQVLALMEPLAETGDVSRANLGYLWDRLAVAENRPQRYGTQGRCVARDRWEPNTIEDPERVEALREAAGIGDLVSYQARMHRYCADFAG